MVPAHAGVVPAVTTCSGSHPSGPRARGGGPYVPDVDEDGLEWSPRTRGWSPGGPAGGLPGVVVPAHAGVVPGARTPAATARSGPRARGGGPWSVPPVTGFEVWSPRTRGWSRGGTRGRPDPDVVPAHAGVVPSRPCPPPPAGSGPRARGGGSLMSARLDATVAVVPAHAGVVLRGGRPPHTVPSGPRARGGGPAHAAWIRLAAEWSPRTWGWSLRAWCPDVPGRVVPAGAGVVPAGAGRSGLLRRGPRVAWGCECRS